MASLPKAVRFNGAATPSFEDDVPLPTSEPSCATAVRPPLPPPTLLIVMVLPAWLTVVLAPEAIVTAPVTPFRLETPAESRLSLKLISNPAESFDPATSAVPATCVP